MPYIGRTLGQGTRSRFLYTATAGQTTFSGSDSQSNTLAYADNNGLDCFQNGVLLKGGGADYTATTGTSVVLTTGASVNDVIEILVYDVFAIADHVKKSGDAMTGALTNIDVNGTELVLDADGDTTITADTDDQIDFKVGGTDRMHLVAEKLGIGESAPSSDLVVKQSGSTFTTSSQTVALFQRNTATGSGCKVTILSGNNTSGDLNFGDAEDEDIGKISYNHNDNTMRFTTNTSERMRIQDGGAVLIGTTSNLIYDDSSSSGAGIVFNYGGANYIQVKRNEGGLLYLNRTGNDGTLVAFHQAGNVEGNISVSGSTVSYNGFSGLHESSGIATDTPVGTVVSTIDELDVYSAKQGEAGEQTDSTKAGQTRADHAKVEVSNTVGDKAVYGVVANFNAQGKVNVTSVGIGSVRVTGACAKGDLLESNGDGTAKVQSDDIVRSKTIGKVTIGNSDTGVKLVSCVLYCG